VGWACALAFTGSVRLLAINASAAKRRRMRLLGRTYAINWRDGYWLTDGNKANFGEKTCSTLRLGALPKPVSIVSVMYNSDI
jgi:hypothetical protein